MKQNSITDLPNLRSENYENIFNVYTDTDGHYYYNLLQTITLPDNLPDGYFNSYNILHGDTWPYISYKVYNTPNMWWLILQVNNISDPTQQPTPGAQIKILQMSVVKDILAQIS
jgi:nucleoid-associated protein YgaU